MVGGHIMTEAPNTDRLFTVKELAKYLNIHAQTVYSMARAGEIPSIRIGRHWRFDLAAVMEAMDVSDESG